MENTDKSLFDLSFDENVKQQLKGAANWAGIAAIVSLIGSILGVVNYFIQQGRLDKYSVGGYEGVQMRQSAAAGGLVSLAITLAIGVILFVFLNKFSKKAKLGVQEGDQLLINEGLGSLSSYFKIIGVIIIIVIVLVFLGVLIALTQRV